MNLPDFKQPEEYRQLRVITILAFVLAAAMLLPYGAITQSALPAIGIAPMFFSAAMGILIFTGMLKSPWTKASMDGGLAVLLLIFMIPCIVSLRKDGWSNDEGVLMLGTYGTSTMILSFAIHSYLGAVSMHHVEFPKLIISWGGSSPCTHCDHHHHSLPLPGGTIGLHVAGADLPHHHGSHEAHQPFIDESDEARRDSSDYQTSGFGSPRRSAETLATDANDLERRAGSFEC